MGGHVEHGPTAAGQAFGHPRQLRRTLDDGAFLLVALAVLVMAAFLRFLRGPAPPFDD